MIENKVHYFWFGKGKYPPMVRISLLTWKQKLNCECILHNEDNYNINEDPEWVRRAYEQGLYAFVSDYARTKVLYNEGGIYLDTDCFINKANCLSEYLNYSFFMPVENVLNDNNLDDYINKVDDMGNNTSNDYVYGINLNPIVFGCEKEHPFLKAVLDLYNTFDVDYAQKARNNEMPIIGPVYSKAIEKFGFKYIDKEQNLLLNSKILDYSKIKHVSSNEQDNLNCDICHLCTHTWFSKK